MTIPVDSQNRIRVANAFERDSLTSMTNGQQVVQLDNYVVYQWNSSTELWDSVDTLRDFTTTDNSKLTELYTANKYPRSGGDYIEFDTKGRPRLEGDNALWEDLRVAMNTTDKANKPPLLMLMKNDGNAVPGTAKAIRLTPTSSASVADNGAFNLDAPFSVEFWVRPTSETSGWDYFIRKVGTFGVRLDNSYRIRLTIDGYAGLNSDPLQLDAWNHVVITILDTSGGNDETKLYVNGVLKDARLSQWGDLTSNTNDIVLNSDGTTIELDELAIWNKVLTASEVSTRYNNGEGSALAGGETDLQGAWGFEEGSGTTISDKTSQGNDFTITGTGYSWVDGWIGASVQGSVGVYVWHFNTGEINEVFFSVQLPHAYKEGTDLKPHIHWTKHNSDSGNVKWGLEYTICNVASTFPDTTTLTSTSVDTGSSTTPYNHLLTNLGTISGTGLTVSSMLIGRLFRDGIDPTDTYDGYAALLEFDIHYQVDSLGSILETAKDPI